jgi:AraC-like DNA-binding protein
MAGMRPTEYESAMSKDSNRQQFSWSTDHLAPNQRLKHWREMFCSTFIECDIDSMDGEAFSASIRYDRYGGVGVGSIDATRRRIVTTPSQAIRNPEGIMLDIVWSGRYRYEAPGKTIELLPGDAVFAPNNVSDVMTALEPAELRAVHIPAQYVEHVFGDVCGMSGRVLRHEQPESRLLTAYLQAVHQTAGLNDPKTREIIGQQIVDLVVTAVGRTHEEAIAMAERGLRAARFKLATDEIRRHLAEPMLNGRRVAAKLGLSERYIQRLFEEKGLTVSQYILDERLKVAHRSLAEPGQDHRHIADIAFSIGFSDITHFNRAFKRRYGDTPSSFRRR